ncbi:LysR family transcriptional regulator [Pseudaquabacterium rugosum]|uniref:LysR family transcriptional regulator n=1 Tax=Pseudaquabacterium rugosum TaxID=2984194 RepID=A0ABU9BHP6_9BURK
MRDEGWGSQPTDPFVSIQGTGRKTLLHTEALGADPRKLLYLATVIEEGSLIKAARLLGISQPALSKSMDRLEAGLGVRLLHRSALGVKPTAMGELFYSHARLIRDETRLAHSRAQGADGPGTLTVGTLPSIASGVMPQAVAAWRERHPAIRIRVIEKVQIELLLGLLRCELDVIVGQTEFYDIFLDGLKQRVLFRDRLRVLARPSHPLFDQVRVGWADLARCPWVCPIVGWAQHTLLERLMTQAGVQPPQDLVECGSIDFTKGLLQSSEHLALLPEHAVTAEILKGRLRALPVDAPEFKRDIAVIFREASPPDSIAADLIAHIAAAGEAQTRRLG